MASDVGGFRVSDGVGLGSRHRRSALANACDGAAVNHRGGASGTGAGGIDSATRIHDRDLPERVSNPASVSLRDFLLPSSHPDDEAHCLLTSILSYVVGDAASETARVLLADAATLPLALVTPDHQVRKLDNGEKLADFLGLLVQAFNHTVEVGLRSPNVRPDADIVRLFLLHRLNHERVEVLYGLFFNSAGTLLHERELARGNSSTCCACRIEIARTALRIGAVAVVLAHNHPSGSPQPSRDDIRFSSEVASSLSLADAALIDHIIVANGATVSMRKLGLLPQGHARTEYSS